MKFCPTNVHFDDVSDRSETNTTLLHTQEVRCSSHRAPTTTLSESVPASDSHGSKPAVDPLLLENSVLVLSAGTVAIVLPLTKGYHALVDEADYDRVRQYKWSAQQIGVNIYAVRGERGKHIYLHRFILDAPAGRKVDHKDGNGLNCTRQNLRLATQAQNNQNRRKAAKNSGYKGVIERGPGRWQARINQKALGTFSNPEAAARAYDEAARKLHGEFARLNFPDDGRRCA